VKSFKPLAQAIRTAARARLRASESLWKEYKRLRRTWASYLRRRSLSLGALYLIVPLAIAFANGNKSAPVLLLSLYSAATIIHRAAALSDVLYRSGDLAYFMHSPAADREFFDFAWPRTFRSALWVWLYSVLTFSFLVVTYGLGGGGWAAALTAATLQWLLVISLVAILAQVPLTSPVRASAAALYFLAFVSLFLPPRFTSFILRILLPLPSSWVPFVFDRALLNQNLEFLYLLLPVLLVIGLLPVAFRRLRHGYPSVELVYPLQTAAAAGSENKEEIDGETETIGRDRDWRSANAAQARDIDISPSLRLFDWNRSPWLERLANRMFNARDKEVAEFLCGGVAAPWSPLWALAFKIAAVGLVVLPWFFDPRIGFVIGCIASMFALPVLGGRWPGLQSLRFSTTVQPVFAAVPISYWDVTSVVFKVNLARYLAWLPVFLAYGAMLGWRLLSSPSQGLEIAIGIFLILLWSQPIVIVGKHSSGTNDTRRITFHSLAWAGVILFLAIIYVLSILLVFSGLLSIGGLLFIIATLGILVSPLMIWLVYKVWYERGKIDTVRAAD
jgi:hypothetical protein